MRTREALHALLGCASQSLDLPVFRSFVYAGRNAPHEDCESDGNGNGQLWVANLGSTAGWSSPTANPLTCAVPFSDEIELGIIRCECGGLSDTGRGFGPADCNTKDADRQQRDKETLKQAILCCWGVDGQDIRNLVWEPIEPVGGCVGGRWTVVLRDASCSCQGEE